MNEGDYGEAYFTPIRKGTKYVFVDAIRAYGKIIKINPTTVLFKDDCRTHTIKKCNFEFKPK